MVFSFSFFLFVGVEKTKHDFIKNVFLYSENFTQSAILLYAIDDLFLFITFQRL